MHRMFSLVENGQMLADLVRSRGEGLEMGVFVELGVQVPLIFSTPEYLIPNPKP